MNQTLPLNRQPARLQHATLRRFCAAHGDTRKQLRQPWICGDGVGATDGSILVYLPETTSEKYRPVYGKLFNVVERFERKYKPAGDGILVADLQLPPMKHCNSCGACGFVIASACTECAGAGRFNHGSHVYGCRNCRASGVHRAPAVGQNSTAAGRETCPDCKGEGEFSMSIPVPVFDGFIRKRYLSMLRDLKGCVLYACADATQNVYPFRFDGGRGWVMPCSPL